MIIEKNNTRNAINAHFRTRKEITETTKHGNNPKI